MHDLISFFFPVSPNTATNRPTISHIKINNLIITLLMNLVQFCLQPFVVTNTAAVEEKTLGFLSVTFLPTHSYWSTEQTQP